MTGRNGRRWLPALALALLAGIGTWTAVGPAGTRAADSLAGTTITIGAMTGTNETNFYKDLIDEFTSQTGINVEWFEVPHENLHERLLTEALSGSGAVDVYMVDQLWMAEFADNGFLAPLDDLLTEDDRADFGATLASGTYKDSVYALPFEVQTAWTFYRKDLLDKAGIAKPPATWDEFRDAAKRTTDASTGTWGTVIMGKQAIDAGLFYADALLQAGGAVLDENEQVVINSPEALRAFEYLLGTQWDDQSSPPGALAYTVGDANDLFINGKAALIRSFVFTMQAATDPTQSKVVGLFGVTDPPADKLSTSSVWAWEFGAASSSKNLAAAKEFVKWATSTDVTYRFAKEMKAPATRTSASEKLKNDTDLTDEERANIGIMVRAIDNGTAITTSAKWPAIHDRLSLGVSRVLSKTSEPAAELASMEQDMKDILGQ